MTWRDDLRPASFRGCEFHVEVRSNAGGRRLVNFEFPKKDTNYVEDMGRRGRRFTVQGYLIGPDFTLDRDALIAAMESEGPGLLVLPTDQQDRLVSPDTYQTNESRTRGGYVEIELAFIENGGETAQVVPGQATANVVSNAATSLAASSAVSLDAALAAL